MLGARVESRDEAAVERGASDGEEGEEKGFRASGAGAPSVDVPEEDVVKAGGGGEGFRGREAAGDERAEKEGNGIAFPEGAEKPLCVRERGAPGLRGGANGVDESPEEELDCADAAGLGAGTGGKRSFGENCKGVEIGGQVFG